MTEPITLEVWFVGIAGTLAMFRVATILITEASNRDTGKTPILQNKKNKKNKSKENYSKIAVSGEESTHTGGATDDDEDDTTNATEDQDDDQEGQSPIVKLLFHISLVSHATLFLVFLGGAYVYKSPTFSYTAGTFLLNTLSQLRDRDRFFLGFFQRFFYFSSSFSVFLSGAIISAQFFLQMPDNFYDPVLTFFMMAYPCLVGLECSSTPYPVAISSLSSTEKPTLSRRTLFIILKPYIWPDATTRSAALNRLLVVVTWVCVVGARACNLVAPVLLGKASTALTHLDYAHCIQLSIAYTVVSFFGKFFKECQGLVYLKVAQAAFVQLSEAAFHHIHTLSLDWHLRKKLGEVLRSMDRGIGACDTLMKFLFLWLLPAVVESVLVCIIFASYFHYTPLSLAVFFFVFTYMVMTIVMTLWRKKFRKAVAKSDNDWHDLCTDSLINFEAVKYFTAEDHEMEKFGAAVSTYQKGSVHVQASGSFLNLSQQILFQTCLATCLSLAVLGIQERMQCCADMGGCSSGSSSSEDSGVSSSMASSISCCANISKTTCPGMEVGDFVAVLTYTINLFGPLNFLGTVYNAIVMAIVDLTNLSELLAEKASVTDMEDADRMPALNDTDPSVSVEFDDVYFHYPTQAENSGLKGMSFTMKRGETTAIVGSTGAGKTTVSRLLFRFYDVLHGAVKINGVDIRAVTQRSLRDLVGVVPQTTTLFNDTLRHNVLYGRRDAPQADLDRVAQDAQLSDFISSLPLGWETKVGDRGLKLSGGEKQRVAIARCLLKNPPIVVLDEATSALDTLTENSVQLALDRLGEDRTCLVIAHRLGTIRNADNIVVLDDGVVAEQGTHDDLLEMDGLYASMWNMQLHTNSDGSIAGTSRKEFDFLDK